MRATCESLELIPPKVLHNTYFDAPVSYIEHNEYFEAKVHISGPFEFVMFTGETPQDAYRRLEREITSAIMHMFDQPTEEESSIVPSLLQCENCKATTRATKPGPGWRQVNNLEESPPYMKPWEPHYFCSAQCQVNFILKNTNQPIVLTPLSR